VCEHWCRSHARLEKRGHRLSWDLTDDCNSCTAKHPCPPTLARRLIQLNTRIMIVRSPILREKVIDLQATCSRAPSNQAQAKIQLPSPNDMHNNTRSFIDCALSYF
jgi:hypothetical protein